MQQTLRQPSVVAPTPAPVEVAPSHQAVQQAGNAAAQEQLVAAGQPESQGFWRGLGELVGILEPDPARDALEDKFVISDAAEGERAPNELTQEEFDAVVELYRAIEAGETDIAFDPGDMDADEFREKVMADIGTILTTRQGRELLRTLAYGSEDGKRHKTTIGGSPEGAGEGTPVDPFAGSDGTGTDMEIDYIPGAEVDVGGGSPDVIGSDVVLFHELVHAYHGHQGTLAFGRDPKTGAIVKTPAEVIVGPDDETAADEEYATVGLCGRGGEYTENGYREERAEILGVDPKLRRNYKGGTGYTDPYISECHTQEERDRLNWEALLGKKEPSETESHDSPAPP
ncbi:MAG: M91 family zinc metallopeptidase [Myxococcota bacterium]